MRARVNTKFVVILVVALVVLMGLVYMVMRYVRNNPEQLAALGDTYMTQKDYSNAADCYGRAVARRPSDVKLLVKYADALDHLTPRNTTEARQYIGLMHSSWVQAITADPDAKVPFQKLMDMEFRIGRELGASDAYSEMLTRAQGLLHVRPKDVLARKYRGIAITSQMRTVGDTPSSQRQQARNDLEAAAQAFPNDPDVFNYLGLWNYFESEYQQQPGGDPTLANTLNAKSLSIAQDAWAKHPKDLRFAMNLLTMLMIHNEVDQARALAKKVESAFLAKPPGVYELLQLANLMPILDTQKVSRKDLPDTTQGLERALALIQVGLKAWPDSMRLQAQQASLYSAMQQPQDALKVLRDLRNAQVSGSPLQYLMHTQIQISADLRYVDLLLNLSNDKSAKDRQAQIAEADQVLKDVHTITGDSAMWNLLSGKLALAKSDPAEAIKKLNTAITQLGDSNRATIEARYLAAKASQELGEPGAAATQLQQLLQQRPDMMPARLMLAQLQLQNHQLDDAEQQVKAVLAADPQNFTANRFQGAILAERGKVKQAIDLYEKLDPAKHPELVQPLAHMYAMDNQTAEAQHLLASSFKQNPKNLALLQNLLTLTPDKTQALAYIEEARAAKANPDALTILESQYSKSSDVQALIEKQLEREKDPFTRHLSLFRFYSGIGKTAEAQKQLQQATALKPDHALIIDLQFKEALAQHDFAAAQKWVNKAVKFDTDSANGRFYVGQLALAQGEYVRAANAFRSGLKILPVSSDGYRLLADAQRAMGDYSDALTNYNHALQQRPQNVAALRGLAITQAALGQSDDAIKTLQQAMQFAPTNASVVNLYLVYQQQLGDPQEALKLRQEIAAKAPANLDNQRALTLLLAQLGDKQEALQHADALLKAHPDDRAVLATVARTRQVLGDEAGGRKLLEDYVHGLGNKAQAQDWLLLASYLVNGQQLDEAGGAFRKAIAIEDPKTTPASRAYGDLLTQLGRFKDAATVYQKVWQADPTDATVGTRYAETLMHAGQLDKAQSVLDTTVKANGPTVATYTLQAQLDRAKGDMAAAVKSINQAVDARPDSPQVYISRAQLLFQQSSPANDNQVINDLNKALSLSPNDLVPQNLLVELYLRRGDWDEGTHQLQVLLSKHPNQRLARLQLVQLYFYSSKWLALSSLLDNSVKLFPKDPLWPQWQAKAAAQQGQYDQAVAYQRKALALHEDAPTLADLVNYLLLDRQGDAAVKLLAEHNDLVSKYPQLGALRARALADSGHVKEATNLLSNLLDQCRDYSSLFRVFAQARLALGEDAAVAQIKDLIAKNPTWYRQLLLAEVALHNQQYAAALKTLQEFGAQVPKNDADQQAYDVMLSLALQQTGKIAEAAEVYHRVLKREPDNMNALNNLAYLLTENLHKPAEALPLAQKAAELRPRDPQVLDTLGWTQFEIGQKDAALRTLQKSVDLQSLAVNNYHLAMILLDRHAIAQAQAYLETARKLAEQHHNQTILKAVEAQLHGSKTTNEAASLPR